VRASAATGSIARGGVDDREKKDEIKELISGVEAL
jgi:hypothetical protein